MPPSKLYDVLTNRYYLGVVTWRAVEYPGRHEPLVAPAVFDAVQAMLRASRDTCERPSKRGHHLVGTLRCARCESRLLYGISTGSGGKYANFFCANRHSARKGRDLPYLASEQRSR